jgi:hypothetical protein
MATLSQSQNQSYLSVSVDVCVHQIRLSGFYFGSAGFRYNHEAHVTAYTTYPSVPVNTSRFVR